MKEDAPVPMELASAVDGEVAVPAVSAAGQSRAEVTKRDHPTLEVSAFVINIAAQSCRMESSDAHRLWLVNVCLCQNSITYQTSPSHAESVSVSLMQALSESARHSHAGEEARLRITAHEPSMVQMELRNMPPLLAERSLDSSGRSLPAAPLRGFATYSLLFPEKARKAIYKKLTTFKKIRSNMLPSGAQYSTQAATRFFESTQAQARQLTSQFSQHTEQQRRSRVHGAHSQSGSAFSVDVLHCQWRRRATTICRDCRRMRNRIQTAPAHTICNTLMRRSTSHTRAR